MKADILLSRLDKVRATGHSEWVACCPAHEDRSPSLSVKDTEDGRVLLHCFAGCSAEDVLTSVGLTFADIMPERVGTVERLKPLRWNPRTVLEAIAHNVTMLALLTSDMAHGEATAEQRDQMFDLSQEILEGVDYATRR